MKQNYMVELLNKYGKPQKTEPRMVQYVREYAEKKRQREKERKDNRKCIYFFK